MSEITIILVDDHPLFRRGLKQLIDEVGDFKVIGEADDGEMALNLIQEQAPDVVISDLEMPKLDGLALTRRICKDHRRSRTIILTMHRGEAMFNEAMKAGAQGFVVKNSAHHDIIQCIRTVIENRRFISPSISDYLFQRNDRSAELKTQKPRLEALTHAERLILRLISSDETTKEIASELGVSPHTVSNHRANICRKLDLQGTHSLLKFAFDNKAAL